MTIHNNYIFLLKQKKETSVQRHDDNNVLRIEIPKTVSCQIKNIFGSPKEMDKTSIDHFKETYTYEIQTDNDVFNVTFTMINVVNYTYLDVCLSGETIEQAIQSLEYIHNKISTSEIEDDYIMIISYDSISEYYCNKAYPKLNELERNLRRLLLNTYTINFGTEYYETFDDGLQEKVKKIIPVPKNNKEKKKIERLKKFFYSMEFGDIQELLFKERWTDIDKNDMEKFFSENQNLNELSNEELKAAFERFSPKSDWEKFFSDKASDVNIKQLIDVVQKQRNDIAHCKFFYKEKYYAFCEVADKLNSSIIDAINITEEKDFQKKRAEYYRTAMAGIAERFAQFQTIIQESFKPIYENTDYLSSAITNSFKSLSESMQANSILPISSMDSDEEMSEDENNDNI